MKLELDKTSGKNGDKVELSVTAIGSTDEPVKVMIVSKLGAQVNIYPLFVGNP